LADDIEDSVILGTQQPRTSRDKSKVSAIL